ILGSFLFRGDDVDKYVKVLSGGERNRLALAKMLLQPFNVLVMDEPTNHLDIKSKNVLKQALQNFEGTLILVSHDRDFLQGLTDRVYEFKDGGIKEYLGDIDFYLEQRKMDDFRSVEKGDQKKEEKPQEKSKESDYHTQKKQKSLKNKLSGVEKRISQLEKEIADIDHDLLMDYDATIAKPDFFDKYEGKKKDLESLMEDWESLSHDLEALD
ncbi:MAG: ATP-binding cassette domain-containing protein, partial [Bacteroidota bacterium]|nr:ATP-binding cassette domain-containing protein [Bacteroidota bacterium]